MYRPGGRDCIGPPDVERVADRLLVLNRGQVARQGSTSELIAEGVTLEESLVEWGAA